MFSELIKRRVIYYAGKIWPPGYFLLVMRGNYVSRCLDRPVFWGKKLLQNI